MQTTEPLVTFDNRISLGEAARLADVSGPSTVFRWISDGRRGVHLEHARLGRRMFTSKPALTKFMNEVARAESNNI